ETCQVARSAPATNQARCGALRIRLTVLSMAAHAWGVTRFSTAGPRWSFHASVRSRKPASASSSTVSGGSDQTALNETAAADVIKRYLRNDRTSSRANDGMTLLF